MDNITPENSSTKVDLIEQLSKIVGERDVLPETLLEKCKDIKDWNQVLEHQKLLSKTLRKDISIQAALLDYLLSSELRAPEAHQFELSTAQKVQYSSIIDPLTGLFNDRHFQVIVDAELMKAKQFTLPLTLIILDMDNFGLYTALYGHETSDIALGETALVLKQSCRKEDMLFRLKKNRFSVTLLNITREGAHSLGERIRFNIEKHHFKGEDKLPTKKLTISGGIAIYPYDGKNSYTLITASEEALITAKQSGKNRILEYSVKRRKTPRVIFETEAKYQIEARKDIKPHTVYTRNLSESGVLITAPSDISLGGLIILNIKLPDGNIIKPKGEAVRISRKEGERTINIAIKFTDILPVDLMVMRNFIEKEISKGTS